MKIGMSDKRLHFRLWLLALLVVAALLVPALVYHNSSSSFPIALAQTPTAVYLDPPLIAPPDFVYLLGDQFAVSIMITEVMDLKSWQAEVSFAKYASVLSVIEVLEGDFLMIGGETYFTWNADPFKGIVKAAATLLGQVSGVSGNGWLATILFQVVGGGESPLDLHDTLLLDSLSTQIGHTTGDGMFRGRAPKASFTVSPSTPSTGETATFNASSSYATVGRIVDYSWNFGDHNYASESDPITYHTYSTATTYLATLTVTDDGGLNASSTVWLTVTAGLPPPPKIRYCTPDFSKAPVPGYYDTSEFMMGSVAVGIILPESTGPAYNWTDDEISTTVGGIMVGMDWWKSQNPGANLSFTYDVHLRVPTGYEPIQRPEWEDFLWIDEVMSSLGYNSGGPWEKVIQYNNDIRRAFGTDWAFTIFVADSDPSVNMGNFVSSGYAHAFFGGPWVTMSRFSSWAYNAESYYDAVPAHETGHIFYATDEYDGIPMTSGYLNTSDQDYSYGIMNRNSFYVSASTRQQIGWVDLDEDGIMDIIDTYPALRLDAYPSSIFSETFQFSGAVVEVPVQNLNPFGQRNNLTINELVSVEFSVDAGSWISATPADGVFDEALEDYTLNAAFPSWGTHLLKIRAANTVGNFREWNFTVETIPPHPVAAFTYAPSNPLVGQTVFFDASSSFDPNGTIMSYLWDFGDGITSSESDPFTTHVYSEPGVFAVSLTVTNNRNQTDATAMTITLKMSSSISVSVNPSIVTLGNSTLISGSITPTRAGVLVAIQWRRNPWDNWTLQAEVVTNQDGEYFYVWTPLDWGDYELRVSWLGDEFTLPSEEVMVVRVILPPPKITINPDSGPTGTKVIVQGYNFPDAASLSLMFDDQLIGFVILDQSGKFNATFSVPLSEVGAHKVKALTMTGYPYYEPVTAEAVFTVVDATPLIVNLDVGSIYFKGEKAEFYIQTVHKGRAVNVTSIIAIIYKPDGTVEALTPIPIATGIFMVEYLVTGKSSQQGVYTLVVEALYKTETVHATGSSVKAFVVKPTWERELPKAAALSTAAVGLISVMFLLLRREGRRHA